MDADIRTLLTSERHMGASPCVGFGRAEKVSAVLMSANAMPTTIVMPLGGCISMAARAQR